MMSRAAQTHLAGHMRPAGLVFETPGIDAQMFGETDHRTSRATHMKNL